MGIHALGEIDMRPYRAARPAVTTHRSGNGGGNWHDERVPTLADSPAAKDVAGRYNRREALRMGGVVVGMTAASTVAACGSANSGYDESTPDPLVALSVAARRRSEERRVGKECLL